MKKEMEQTDKIEVKVHEPKKSSINFRIASAKQERLIEKLKEKGVTQADFFDAVIDGFIEGKIKI